MDIGLVERTKTKKIFWGFLPHSDHADRAVGFISMRAASAFLMQISMLVACRSDIRTGQINGILPMTAKEKYQLMVR